MRVCQWTGIPDPNCDCAEDLLMTPCLEQGGGIRDVNGTISALGNQPKGLPEECTLTRSGRLGAAPAGE